MSAWQNIPALSRDPHLTLRRVERQHQLIVLLSRCTQRQTSQQLADRLGVTTRTVARDLQRLQHSGVPVHVAPGRGGGARLQAAASQTVVALDVDEIAALIASLAAVGPTTSDPAESAMRKLVSALTTGDTGTWRSPTNQ